MSAKALFVVNFERADSEVEETVLAEERDIETWFAEFVSANERSLRQALTAALGPELAHDATAEALAYAWEHRERVEGLQNPAGYLYRLGLNWGRKTAGRRTPAFPISPPEAESLFEPGLPDALAELSEKQRLVVYLVHGLDWSLSEVAEVLEVSKGTAQKHMERGMARLRRQLKVDV